MSGLDERRFSLTRLYSEWVARAQGRSIRAARADDAPPGRLIRSRSDGDMRLAIAPSAPDAGKSAHAGVHGAGVHGMNEGVGGSSPALARMIETEIIPRLLLSHREMRARQEALIAAGRPINGHEAKIGRADAATVSDSDRHDIALFTELLVRPTDAAARSYIDSLCASGLPLETLFLDVMTPAARSLGEGWEQDRFSFSDVTIGLCRLHEMLNRLSYIYSGRVGGSGAGHSIALAAPNEQHTFGLIMTGEFFRRAGWFVWPETPLSCDAAVALARDERFDVIGFSASADRALGPLADTIVEVRRVSANSAVRILVGGSAFIRDPDAVEKVGADALAVDGRDAVLQAEALLDHALKRY